MSNTIHTALIYSEKFLTYNFGKYHPLRPLRLELTHLLMQEYGLLQNPALTIEDADPATDEELAMVHDPEYIRVVKEYSSHPNDFIRDYPGGAFGLGTWDDPVFKGMYEASAMIAGASIKGAEILMSEKNIRHVFNFGGGLHHAVRDKASGFCIFNDAALAIKKIRIEDPDARVMYIDVDAHHGDGVQWTFYEDPKVLTVSFHQDGSTLFPGTGFTNERGKNEGYGYSVNFPLEPETYDEPYLYLFRKTVPAMMKKYKPKYVVTQLGVDTHFYDPLTRLGLSTSGHEKIYTEIKEAVEEYGGDKWLALGGGGYLMTVVPRSWSMALAVMLNVELPNSLPQRWLDTVKEKVDDEIIPDKLRDINVHTEQRLLKNPMFSEKIDKRINELLDFFRSEVLPAIEPV